MEKLDGKFVSNYVKNKVKQEISALKSIGVDRVPGLAVIIVGDNDASNIYVRNKEKACNYCGINSSIIRFDSNTSEDTIISCIEKLNNDNMVDGILCQLPLPQGINEKRVLNSISPNKDVDCFSNLRMGNLLLHNECVVYPCTPYGIMTLLDFYSIGIEGKYCVVVGRSNIVGKPMALMLLKKNATITVCHSKTKNLKDICKKADILVSAVGKANFITKDMVKENAVVIDVGMNRENGKLCGDVSSEVSEKVSWLTPVPGGVGPMTVAMLMQNTLNLFMEHENLK